MIPVINDGGSDGSLLDMMYGRLPMIGKRGGPEGHLLGFIVPLYVDNIKRAMMTKIGIHMLIAVV